MPERRHGDRRNNNRDYLMTDSKVSELAGVSVHTVKYWRLAGTLPFVKVGRHPRVWFSVFQKIFHKPDEKGYWEMVGKSDKITPGNGR